VWTSQIHRRCPGNVSLSCLRKLHFFKTCIPSQYTPFIAYIGTPSPSPSFPPLLPRVRGLGGPAPYSLPNHAHVPRRQIAGEWPHPSAPHHNRTLAPGQWGRAGSLNPPRRDAIGAAVWKAEAGAWAGAWGHAPPLVDYDDEEDSPGTDDDGRAGVRPRPRDRDRRGGGGSASGYQRPGSTYWEPCPLPLNGL